MRTPTVALTALAFGFGPASHASTIAGVLRRRRPELRLIGVADGVAHRFMAGSDRFDELLYSQAGAWPETITESHEEPSIVISIADFDRALVAKRRGSRVVLVDALYWMWDQCPIDPTTVDVYLCLAFPGLEEKLRGERRQASAPRVIPQILDAAAAPQADARREGILLNLGGAISPFGGNHAYLAALVQCVARAVRRELAQDLLVTCSAPAAEALRAAGTDLGAPIVELPFERMMQALADHALLLTLPGLSIMWEAWRARIPTIVLPGANYSHHGQVAAYRRFLPGWPILTWDDLADFAQLPIGLSEEIGVSRAIELGERFAADQAARQQLEASVCKILHGGVIEQPEMPAWHPWGGFDGAEYVGDEVLRTLAPGS